MSETPASSPSVEDELERIMNRSPSPVPSTRDEDPSDPSAEDPAVGGADSPIGPVRNELALARRLGAERKLHPFQRQKVDELVKAPNLVRDIMMFVQMCELENRLDKIITEAPPYEVSEPLKVNIKNIVVAVLLSPKLSFYKGEIPKESVLKVLLKDRLHIPSTYDTDSYVSSKIEGEIGEELTQTRSKIKKIVVASVKSGTRLFDVASKLVVGTKCSATVPLNAKVALLRKIIGEDKAGTDFWDTVDARLKLIRDTAGGNQTKINRAFSAWVKEDHEKYGASAQAPPSADQNTWQMNIDDALST